MRLRPVVHFAKTRGHGSVAGGLPNWLIPKGWIVGPPDFVGLGAQKSGTSWWYRTIAAHPRFHRLPLAPKECHYFDRFGRARFTDAAIARYHRLFPRPPRTVSGEWTPRYMFDLWTPELIRRAAPDARLLVLLRDPIERYRSGVAAREGRLSGVDLRADAYARGFYHAQLSRVLDHFDRERLLVLQYERCRDEPEREFRRTLAFLGLDEVVLPELHRRVHVTRREKGDLSPDLVDTLRRGYREDATRLFEAFPELDPALWTTLAL